MAKRLLTIFAHPDDAECVAGGSLLKWRDEGWEITLGIVTDGDKGSNDPDEPPAEVMRKRRIEQARAAEMLGARVVYLGFEDGYLQPTLDLRREIVRLTRQVRPQRVVPTDPSVWFRRDVYVNHPDHRAAGQAALEALYPAVKKPHTFPELLAGGLRPHVVDEIWLGPAERPNRWIDIAEVLERKIDLICCHASQFPRELAAPAFTAFARESGEGQGLAAAEAFHVVHLVRQTIRIMAEEQG